MAVTTDLRCHEGHLAGAHDSRAPRQHETKANEYVAFRVPRIIDAYSWVTDGVPFQMRVDAIASGGVWVGHFQVGRCSSPGPTEKWRVGMDTVIPVLNAEATERPGEGTVLSLSYATQCLLQDRACWTAELNQLWPTLQSRAAGRPIAVIDIGVEGCLGDSVSFQVTRSKDGRWAGLWTPETP